jgi:hypothetical protein
MKIEILHNIFGAITYDDGQLTVRKPDLAERITWLLKHEDDLHGLKHYQTGMQGRLIAILEYMGLSGGITKVTATGAEPLPPGATP